MHAHYTHIPSLWGNLIIWLLCKHDLIYWYGTISNFVDYIFGFFEFRYALNFPASGLFWKILSYRKIDWNNIFREAACDVLLKINAITLRVRALFLPSPRAIIRTHNKLTVLHKLKSSVLTLLPSWILKPLKCCLDGSLFRS